MIQQAEYLPFNILLEQAAAETQVRLYAVRSTLGCTTPAGHNAAAV